MRSEPLPVIACTLDPVELPGRIAAWKAIVAGATARTTTDSGATRLELGTAVDVRELATLVAAEQACCAFFAFAITVDQRGVGLEVHAPPDATGLIDELLSAAPPTPDG